MHSIKYFVFALSGLGFFFFFFFPSVFHYSLSSQCALVTQLWFCFPYPNQTLGLALAWLWLESIWLAQAYIWNEQPKKKCSQIFYSECQREKIISFVDAIAKYSNTSSCFNLLFSLPVCRKIGLQRLLV